MIKNLTDEEQMQIIQDRGLSNVRDIMNTSFAQMQTVQQISKEDYFASAIVDTYDWDKINVEELSITERNELIQKLKQSNCVSIYEKLKEAGIENKDIPTAVINIASKGNLKGILESENYIEQIQNNIEEITQGLSIEQVERYLGYYDVKGTGIELRDYQQDAVNKADEIYKDVIRSLSPTFISAASTRNSATPILEKYLIPLPTYTLRSVASEP